jgi:hypothetical protein
MLSLYPLLVEILSTVLQEKPLSAFDQLLIAQGKQVERHATFPLPAAS